MVDGHNNMCITCKEFQMECKMFNSREPDGADQTQVTTSGAPGMLRQEQKNILERKREM